MKFALSVLASLAIAFQALGGLSIGSCMGCDVAHEVNEAPSHCHSGSCDGGHLHSEPSNSGDEQKDRSPCNCHCHAVDQQLVEEFGIEFRSSSSSIPSEPVADRDFSPYSTALVAKALNERGPPPDQLTSRHQTAKRTLWSVYLL